MASLEAATCFRAAFLSQRRQSRRSRRACIGGDAGRQKRASARCMTNAAIGRCTLSAHRSFVELQARRGPRSSIHWTCHGSANIKQHLFPNITGPLGSCILRGQTKQVALAAASGAMHAQRQTRIIERAPDSPASKTTTTYPKLLEMRSLAPAVGLPCFRSRQGHATHAVESEEAGQSELQKPHVSWLTSTNARAQNTACAHAPSTSLLRGPAPLDQHPSFSIVNHSLFGCHASRPLARNNQSSNHGTMLISPYSPPT